MAKGFIKSTEETVVDENGIQRQRTVSKEYHYKTEEDSFYMVFIDFVKWMYNITSVGSLKLLPKLLEDAEFGTGKISLSPGKRLAIQNELDMSKSAFTRALNDLIENNALYRTYIDIIDKSTGEITGKEEVKGEYLVNPEMFWKGQLKDRSELRIKFETIFKNPIQEIKS